MSDLTFGWCGHTSLASELVAPVRRASVRTAAHGRPISLTLWRGDGSGLRIQSRMQDLAERLEVGVLTFDVVDRPFADELVVELPATFNGPIEATKLLIAESGASAESGVVLRGGDDSQIIAMAGANPFTIAVKGVIEGPHVFEPEYPMESYTAASLGIRGG